MIDEHKEELAAMYALGMMEPQEALAFEAELRADAELRKFVDDLLHSSAAMVHACPAKSAPSHLKEKVLLEIRSGNPAGSAAGKNTSKGNVVPFQRPPFAWFPWAMAAGLMVMCGWLYANQVKLKNQIADLLNKNDICQMRFALLDPMNGAHGTATVVWDSSTQMGMLDGNMPRPAANEDYQLWVVGDQFPQPVDAGVISVDEKGEAKLPFKLKQQVSPRDQFAITIEKKGGMPKPSGSPVMMSGKKNDQ